MIKHHLVEQFIRWNNHNPEVIPNLIGHVIQKTPILCSGNNLAEKKNGEVKY